MTGKICTCLGLIDVIMKTIQLQSINVFATRRLFYCCANSKLFFQFNRFILFDCWLNLVYDLIELWVSFRTNYVDRLGDDEFSASFSLAKKIFFFIIIYYKDAMCWAVIANWFQRTWKLLFILIFKNFKKFSRHFFSKLNFNLYFRCLSLSNFFF